MERAAQATDQFDVVLLFIDQVGAAASAASQRLTFGKALQERFFDYHEDVDAATRGRHAGRTHH